VRWRITWRGRRNRLLRQCARPVPGVPVLAGALLLYVVRFTDLPERISYFYRETGFVTLLFSRRDQWAVEALEILGGYRPHEVLFGGGAWIREMSRIDIVEIDPIDSLMSFGMVGLIVMYSPYITALFGGVASKYSRQSKLVVALVTAVSCTAGHVLFSGLAAPLIAGVLALASYRERVPNGSTPGLNARIGDGPAVP